MSETELTKEIKKALRGYAPKMSGKMRTIRWAEEVNVGSGYVDVIRFEDYITKDNSFCNLAEIDHRQCKIEGKSFPCSDCHGCVHKRHSHELGILTTCFEIKITIADFKSKNGHNFVGNMNYYVIPKEMYRSISEMLPPDIGVILYYGHGYLKKKKECTFHKIEEADLNRYLYNALKKWNDQWPFLINN